jgi:CCR4-NOT transcription complex subunit 7/8
MEYEFTLIRQFTRSYPFATIDTEFPGVVYKALAHPPHMSPHQHYTSTLVKKNVDSLKLIQIGLTLCTSHSGVRFSPPGYLISEASNPLQDPHASSSIYLSESHGMNLWMNYYHGIDPQKFRLLILSRKWIGFHLAYGIDYLVKVFLQAQICRTH